MAKVIIIYKLKPGVTAAAFESWVKTVDQPTMRGLKRVAGFETHRAERLLFAPDKPSMDYVEIFDVPDLDGFVAEDIPGPTVQKIMGEFMGFAEAPEFIVATGL